MHTLVSRIRGLWRNALLLVHDLALSVVLYSYSRLCGRRPGLARCFAVARVLRTHKL